MNQKPLSTEPYKGVRDFYPDDMAVQRYISDTWSRTAESFGYERYDASVLEPTGLYESKSSEEIVSEQTYTFTDRGERSVTLRPEMTPTVARMVAGKRRELTFPLRWYSIPNLFRYERPQKGRLREHWQLNCDLFGVDHFSADVEMIALAHQMLIDFGATADMFEIRINHRKLLVEGIIALAEEAGTKLTDSQVQQAIRLMDKRNKLEHKEFNKALTEIVGADATEVILAKYNADDMKERVTASGAYKELIAVRDGLAELDIKTKLDMELARGFDYYTGTIFEIFDVSGENKRSLLGGGRYDNLTELFGGDPIAGIGFGMGDVTMRDFLETHNLLTANLTSPTVMVIPTDASLNIEGEKVAQTLRARGISVATDISTKKLGKKISAAGAAFVEYALVVGEDEVKNGTYVLKELHEGTETSGTLDELGDKIEE
jgi:histidyl-tRNA synthetase